MSIESIIYEPLDGNMTARVRELPAASPVTPGMLVEVSEGEVQPHSTLGGTAQKLFAIENLANAGVIDTVYAAGDATSHYAAINGDRAYALVSAATAAISVDDFLMSDGAGGVITLTNAADDQPAKAIARALESVDNSGGASAVRIKVEVL